MAGSNFWGSLISALRREQSISQRALSECTDVNRSTLRRIEAGWTGADIETVERVLKFLGYELEAIGHDSIEQRALRHKALLADPTKRSLLAAERLMRIGVPS